MAQKPVSPEDAQAALNAYAAAGDKVKTAAANIGMAEGTFRNRLRAARNLGLVAEASAVEKLTERDKIGLKDQVRLLKSQLASAHRESITAEFVRKHILGLAEQVPDQPEWLVKTSKRHGVAGVPCVLWSDWHWGEVVEKDQVGGVNEYNLEIAQRRARALVERTIDLCFNHMTGTSYPGIVVNLGGDMISGDIHEELSETNELPTMPVLLDLAGVLIWALRTMADRFGKVFVPCVVGNHGRNTRRPRMKNRVYSNFDWLLYSFLEKHFESDKRVRFMIPTGVDAHYRVFSHRYLLTHGDSIGGRGGDGWSGMVLPVMKGSVKTSISASRLGQDFDTLLMGHWHQYWPTPRVIVNGCLKGYDEYARVELRASPETPIQALWFTHPKRGVTCHWKVMVDEPADQAEVKDWVSVMQ